MNSPILSTIGRVKPGRKAFALTFAPALVLGLIFAMGGDDGQSAFAQSSGELRAMGQDESDPNLGLDPDNGSSSGVILKRQVDEFDRDPDFSDPPPAVPEAQPLPDNLENAQDIPQEPQNQGVVVPVEPGVAADPDSSLPPEYQNGEPQNGSGAPGSEQGVNQGTGAGGMPTDADGNIIAQPGTVIDPATGDPVTQQEEDTRITNRVAVFYGLDKITGNIITFDVYINETVQFGVLQVTPKVCYSRPPTQTPKTTAFIEVDEQTLDRKIRRVFNGWMFADSPGLNALEHPVYDIWLKDCKMDSEVAAPEGEASAAKPPKSASDAVPSKDVAKDAAEDKVSAGEAAVAPSGEGASTPVPLPASRPPAAQQ